MSNIYKWDDVEFHKSFQPQDSYIANIMEAALVAEVADMMNGVETATEALPTWRRYADIS